MGGLVSYTISPIFATTNWETEAEGSEMTWPGLLEGAGATGRILLEEDCSAFWGHWK